MKPLAPSLLLVASRCLLPASSFSVVVDPVFSFSRRLEAASDHRWVKSSSTLFASEISSSASWNTSNERKDSSDDVSVNDPSDDSQDSDQESGLRGNRFSRYAPDANLPPDEFRLQLKENMKANLEERRRNNPNRGNQPAKSYLDSL
jgi:hypothetical protein